MTEETQQGKRPVALITGSGRGIGYGIAECLAADGFDIVVNNTNEASLVDNALENLRAKGADVLYCRADISDADDPARMLAAVKKHFGRLNVLVNNAGVAPKVRADILEATEESFERLVRINLQGPYFLTQAAANWMIEQKAADAAFRGCVINISSISATAATPARGDYCITKAGIAMATKLWAVRLAEFDIPVYEIRPGIIETDMTAAVKGKYDRLIGEEGLLLQARWGYPEDVGKATAALARGDFPYSTGQVVMVDGGFAIDRL